MRRVSRTGHFHRRRALAAAVAGFLAVVALGAVRANVAAANVCSPNGTHLYGEACLFGDTFLGVSDDIQSDALTLSDPSHSHVINDLWIVNPNSSPPHFIEAGMFYGNICTDLDLQNNDCSSSWIADPNHRLFWAEQRAGTNHYWAHVGPVADLNTTYFDRISTQDSSSWDVYIGGYTGTSTADTLNAQLIRTGTEETTPSATSCSGQSHLEYKDGAGNWISGWSDSSHGDAELGQDSPPYAKWLIVDSQLRDWSGLTYTQCWGTTAASSSGSPAIAPATTSPSSPAATGTPVSPGQIGQIGQGFAAAMGDANPTSIEHIQGPHQQTVLALSGDEVPDNTEVYAIVMRGQFVDRNAPRPPEAQAPSGSVLTIIINANTGHLTDFGIADGAPSLTTLGPVTVDR